MRVAFLTRVYTSPLSNARENQTTASLYAGTRRRLIIKHLSPLPLVLTHASRLIYLYLHNAKKAKRRIPSRPSTLFKAYLPCQFALHQPPTYFDPPFLFHPFLHLS